MKIDVTAIVMEHLRTLYDAKSNSRSYKDVAVFYIVPFFPALAIYYLRIPFKVDAYNVSVTFFGIFIALLLNIQVAMFSVYSRKWNISNDENLKKIAEADLEQRRKLLGELNSNISYLTVVSCVALAMVFVFFVFEAKCGFAPAATTFIYSHFLLTFLMVIKRSHALFQREYREV